MKILTTVSLLLIVIKLSAQQQIGFHYVLGKNTLINYVYNDTSYAPNGDTVVTIHKHMVEKIAQPQDEVTNKKTVKTIIEEPFTICSDHLRAGLTQTDDGKIIIDFWGIVNEKNCPDCSKPNCVKANNKLGQFYMNISQRSKLADVTRYRSIKFRSLEIGAATVPFKYRFGYKKDTIHVPNDASASFNAGIYFGYKWGHTNFYLDKAKASSGSLTVGAFVTPTMIAVSSENTFTIKDSIENKILAQKPNELGLSIGLGFVLANRNLSVSLLYGYDFGITGLSKYWYYNNRPWLGIGFGYKISTLGER